ncbi:MAG: GAF domain-containing protein [bacterium]|nr:GAF domain-containing protein [bacterium]
MTEFRFGYILLLIVVALVPTVIIALYHRRLTKAVIAIPDAEENPFKAEAALLQLLSDPAVSTDEIELQLQKRIGELSLLFSLGQSLAHTAGPEQAVQAIISYAMHILQVKRCICLKYNEAHDIIDIDGYYGLSRLFLSAYCSCPPDEIVGMAIRESRTVQVNLEDDLMADKRKLYKSEGVGGLLVAPLIYDDRPVGALIVFSDKDEDFRPEAGRLLTSVAHQAAAAVRNTALCSELEMRNQQIAALSDISGAINSLMALEAVMQKILWSIASIFEARACLVFLFDEREELRLDSYCGYTVEDLPDEPLKRGRAVTAVLATGNPQSVDYEEAPEIFELISYPDNCLAVLLPLAIKNRSTGIMAVILPFGHPLTVDDRALMMTFATQVAIAIENNQLYDSMEHRINELTTLVRVVASIASTLDLKFVLDTIVQLAAHVMNGILCSIRLIDEESGALKIFSSLGMSEDLSGEYGDRSKGEVLSISVIKDGRPVIIPDVAIDPRLTAHRTADNHGLHSYLGVPLICQGETIGVLEIYCRHKKQFNEAEIRLFWAFADQAAIAVHNARLFDQVQNYSRQLSVIMQEVHHRVKNNLQAVADLLSLEMLQTTGRPSHEILHNSINRIKSIAAVHDLLSHEDVELTDMKHISQRIIDIVGDMADSGKTVCFSVTGNRIFLRSKQATYLALVLNELLINTIKHAFEGKEKGRVSVEMSEEERFVSLVVRDDGKGIPEGFDIDSHSHLGLQIVRNLVERDLHGTLTYHNDQGAVWHIRFAKDMKEDNFAVYGNEGNNC